MKHLIKLPNQDSIGFTEYKSFYSSLVQVEKTRLKENFSTFLETINNLDDLYKFRAFDDFIDTIVSRHLLDTYFSRLESQFLTYLNVVRNVPDKSLALYYLYNVALKTGLINDHFPFFLESIERLTNEFQLPSDSVFRLFKAAYETGLTEKYSAELFKIVDRLSNYWKYHAFAQLINVTVEKRLIKKYIPAFMERIDALADEYKHRATYQLIDVIRNAELFHKYSTQIKTLTVNFIDTFEKAPIPKFRAFTLLLELLKITGMLTNYFSELIEIIAKYLGNQKYHALSKLIDLAKKTGNLERYYVEIKNKFFFFLEDIEKFVNLNKYDAIHTLLKLEEGTGLIVDYTPIILEMIKKISHYENVRYYAFSELLEALKNSGIKKDQFPVFLEILETYPSPSNYDAICSLLEIANIDDLVKENFISIIQVILSFYGLSKYNAFHEIIKKIKSTDLQIEYKSEIKSSFHSLLKDLMNLEYFEQYHGFITLLEITKEIKSMNKFLDEMLVIFPELPDLDLLNECDKVDIYSTFIKTIKCAGLENEQAFKVWKEKNRHFSIEDYTS